MLSHTYFILAVMLTALGLAGCKSTSNWMQSFRGLNSDTGNLAPQVGQYDQPTPAQP